MRKHICFIGLLLIGCINPNQKSAKVSIVNSLADNYYERYLDHFPEQAYFFGIEVKNHDGVESREINDIRKWEHYEDSLYQQLNKIDLKTAHLNQKDLITYWILKESLESSIQIRSCSLELWSGVNHLSGWQDTYSILAGLQPVGTEELRNRAINRWSKLPARIETEMKNLRIGLSKGYSMPKEIVELVIKQMAVFESYPLEKSPFMSPALRDGDPSFTEKWKKIVSGGINLAIRHYAEFLKTEYLPAARDRVSLLTLPDGDKCYQAFIRNYTTRNITPEEIYNQGNKIVAQNIETVKQLGLELYQTDNFEAIVKKVQEDITYNFKSEAEILAFSNQIIANAKEQSTKWFTTLPTKDVTIKPYEAHEAGVGSYEPASGAKPAYYRITLKEPKLQKKMEVEVTGYHETYPGHHVQIGIQQDIKGFHPISKISFFGSYAEGWARYSEQLAEEMGLYQNQGSLIKRRTWPARGMVLDPGIHIKNWSKENVVKWCKQAGKSEDWGIQLYYRSIVWPSQLTSYDVGGEEFKALRKMAEERLGKSFDIKEFHSKVLENGSVPLGMLRSNIEKWVESKSVR